MKNSEIKSLFRYCVGIAEKQGLEVYFESGGVEWNFDKKAWEPWAENKVCVLGAVLLTKQWNPSSKNKEINEGWRHHASAEGVVTDTVAENIGWTELDIYSFFDGLEEKIGRVGLNKEAYAIGLYMKNRAKS